MTIADAVKPVQESSLPELGASVAALFSVISWGTPGAEADNKIAVELQLKDIQGANNAKVERIRLTSSAGTMAIGTRAKGTVLSGSGTADVIVETNASGAVSLEVTYAQAGTITVIGGATQGSGFVSGSASIDLVFGA